MFFGKEKDFILKLTNIVLILWLIGAISALQFSVVNLVFKSPKLTFDEYKSYYCYDYRYYEKEIDTPIMDDKNCENQYKTYLIENKKTDESDVKPIFISVGNVLIVGAALFLINKERK